MNPEIRIQWLVEEDRRCLPAYQTPGSAGMDLHAVEAFELAPMERVLVPCGFAMAIPDGFEVQVRPRSGLAYRQGLTVANAPGTIDSDYRGELKVLLVNLGNETCKIAIGDRVAQMIVAPVVQSRWLEVEDLDETEREAGGFGHTGVEGGS